MCFPMCVKLLAVLKIIAHPKTVYNQCENAAIFLAISAIAAPSALMKRVFSFKSFQFMAECLLHDIYVCLHY